MITNYTFLTELGLALVEVIVILFWAAGVTNMSVAKRLYVKGLEEDADPYDRRGTEFFVVYTILFVLFCAGTYFLITKNIMGELLTKERLVATLTIFVLLAVPGIIIYIAMDTSEKKISKLKEKQKLGTSNQSLNQPTDSNDSNLQSNVQDSTKVNKKSKLVVPPVSSDKQPFSDNFPNNSSNIQNEGITSENPVFSGPKPVFKPIVQPMPSDSQPQAINSTPQPEVRSFNQASVLQGSVNDIAGEPETIIPAQPQNLQSFSTPQSAPDYEEPSQAEQDELVEFLSRNQRKNIAPEPPVQQEIHQPAPESQSIEDFLATNRSPQGPVSIAPAHQETPVSHIGSPRELPADAIIQPEPVAQPLRHINAQSVFNNPVEDYNANITKQSFQQNIENHNDSAPIPAMSSEESEIKSFYDKKSMEQEITPFGYRNQNYSENNTEDKPNFFNNRQYSQNDDEPIYQDTPIVPQRISAEEILSMNGTMPFAGQSANYQKESEKLEKKSEDMRREFNERTNQFNETPEPVSKYPSVTPNAVPDYLTSSPEETRKEPNSDLFNDVFKEVDKEDFVSSEPSELKVEDTNINNRKNSIVIHFVPAVDNELPLSAWLFKAMLNANFAVEHLILETAEGKESIPFEEVDSSQTLADIIWNKNAKSASLSLRYFNNPVIAGYNVINGTPYIAIGKTFTEDYTELEKELGIVR